jgi:hypothetical protein
LPVACARIGHNGWEVVGVNRADRIRAAIDALKPHPAPLKPSRRQAVDAMSVRLEAVKRLRAELRNIEHGQMEIEVAMEEPAVHRMSESKARAAVAEAEWRERRRGMVKASGLENVSPAIRVQMADEDATRREVVKAMGYNPDTGWSS